MTKLILALVVCWLSTAWAETPVVLCDADRGLTLLGQDSYSTQQVMMILQACDKVAPNDYSVLLLHGLVARAGAADSHQFDEAISWFKKAALAAKPNDYSALIELAVTYEQSKNLPEALKLYQFILTQNATNRVALLGKARVLRLDKLNAEATLIYQKLLELNPNDPDALNGMGWINAEENNLEGASRYFQKTLSILPDNQEAVLALTKITATEQQLPGKCNIALGLSLIDQKNPPLGQIEEILKECEVNHIDNSQTRLLQGLLSRFQNHVTKHYKTAIAWLEKSSELADKSNLTPKLELALTYEWSGEMSQALEIYQSILNENSQNVPSLLGVARIYRRQGKSNEALSLYDRLLHLNPNNIDALNGCAWIAIQKKKVDLARQLFLNSLKVQPQNPEALLGLKQIDNPVQPSVVVPLCDASTGLILLNKKNPPLPQIQVILGRCDKFSPFTADTFLLHGLYERYLAKTTNQYDTAILWLKKAVLSAHPGDYSALNELALTYEQSGKDEKALIIYQAILNSNGKNKAALLGKARVLRAEYKIPLSLAIYNQLLIDNPKDIEALNGKAQSLLANYQFEQSRESLNAALAINPRNLESMATLNNLNNATKYVLGTSGGNYSVPPEVSNGLNVYFFDNLNATDGLTLFATHNTKQIGESFFSGPTLLPSNSVLLGFQHRIPNHYGWAVSYDYRQHDGLPLENRILASTNLYFNRELEWFNGFRAGFGSPWKNQLVYSGATLYTNLPVNVSLTGFWANQEIGGKSSSYSLDFTKEYPSRLFYNIGPSYSPTLKNWEIHGKITLPTYKNQALIADISHFFFNQSTFLNVGWQFYWA